jgi:hypothetical protein
MSRLIRAFISMTGGKVEKKITGGDELRRGLLEGHGPEREPDISTSNLPAANHSEQNSLPPKRQFLF